MSEKILFQKVVSAQPNFFVVAEFQLRRRRERERESGWVRKSERERERQSYSERMPTRSLPL